MKKFKIRCSAIGKIMTEPRAKKDKLSGTTKTYLQEWLKEQLYGSKKNTSSKYTEKGLEMEDEAIAYIANQSNNFFLKNEKKYFNKYMMGTPDIITEVNILDVKCSWDMWTFPLFEEELPSKDYYWQMQGYMELTGLKNASVIYALMNTPDELLNPWQDVPYDYEGLDNKLRIKSFHVKYDKEAVEKIEQRVKDCREYINELLDGIYK